MDDGSILLARLQRARRRLAEAPVSSPDWDAATELVLDLERRLAMVAEDAHPQTTSTREAAPVTVG